MLLDVDRGEHVVLDETLGQDDGVLVVVALPWHEGHKKVLPQGELTVVRARTIGDQVARLKLVTLVDERTLVDAGVLVRSAELCQGIGLLAEHTTHSVLLTRLVLNHHPVTADLSHGAGAFGDDHVTGVASCSSLDAGADVRRLRHDQRHSLLLHVGAHEGSVGVIVLDEGDQCGRDRDDLLGRDVDQVDLCRRNEVDLRCGRRERVHRTHAHASALRATTHEHALFEEVALGIDGRVGLGDDVLFFLVSCEVHDLVSDSTLEYLAVRSLDEAIVIHPGVGGQRTDQADIRAFRGLNRAHTSVVGAVDVSNLEASTLTREATRAESREATLVRKARQRVVLVHELTEL